MRCTLSQVKRLVKIFSAILLVLVVSAAGARAADGPPFSFPLDCDIDKGCWFLNYPDTDRRIGVAKDFACGDLAYDNDFSVRIALGSVASLRNPPAVAAAAGGKVKQVLDGIEDLVITSRAQLAKGTPECGNAVIIDHENGWETAYCHLRKGSITVKKGERVERSQIIGAAGSSGFATWPQLGFITVKHGLPFDPVSGLTTYEKCGVKRTPLLDLGRQFFIYRPAAITGIGFTDTSQTIANILRGDALSYASLRANTKFLVLWMRILNIRKDDRIEVTMTNPSGNVISRKTVIAKKDEASFALNTAKGKGFFNWPAGVYTGTVTVTRNVDFKPYSFTNVTTVTVGGQ